MLSTVYKTVRRPSVRSFHHSPAAVAGLLLSAVLAGHMDPQQHGAQQQMRGVSSFDQS